MKAFGGDTTVKGNTGPFWVGSGMLIPPHELLNLSLKNYLYDIKA